MICTSVLDGSMNQEVEISDCQLSENKVHNKGMFIGDTYMETFPGEKFLSHISGRYNYFVPSHFG